MAASFPNSIASFTTKRNLFDDVNANDINRMQEEIVAIESVLGALLNDEDDTDPEDTTNTVINNRFKNLKKRIEYIAWGFHVPAVELKVRDVKVAKTVLPEGHEPKTLKLDDPARTMGIQDPFDMYDGTGFTIKRSGFWLLQGHIRFETTLGQGAKNLGVYEAAVKTNDSWAPGLDRANSVFDDAKGIPDARYQFVFLNPIRMGWFKAGTKVRLGALQSSELTQNVALGTLSGVLLRRAGDPDGRNDGYFRDMRDIPGFVR